MNGRIECRDGMPLSWSRRVDPALVLICGGAHDHPQQGRQIVRANSKEEDTIDQQSGKTRVESDTDAPQHVDEHENSSTEISCLGGDECPKDHQGFSADNREQPPAIGNVCPMRAITKSANSHRSNGSAATPRKRMPAPKTPLEATRVKNENTRRGFVRSDHTA